MKRTRKKYHGAEMNIKLKMIAAVLLAALFFTLPACKSLKNVLDAVNQLDKLKFKLENVKDFRLSGISIKNKNKLSDFSLTDALSLQRVFATGELPADFILNVAVINPNEGQRGFEKIDATLARLDWNLYIDDTKTISGVMDTPLTIPGTGESVNVPIVISLDMLKFFKDRSYEKIADLALAMGGVHGTASKITLDAKPTVETKFGPITYPGRIKIVDKEWKNQ